MEFSVGMLSCPFDNLLCPAIDDILRRLIDLIGWVKINMLYCTFFFLQTIDMLICNMHHLNKVNKMV